MAKKKTKKLIIDKYDPVIYPRYVWVAKYLTLKKLNERFCTRNGRDFTEEWDPSGSVYTLLVKDRKTDKYGVLVNFAEWGWSEGKDEFIGNIAHEAEHVKYMIFEDCGMTYNEQSQEADAYLVGWVAKCIYATLTK